MHLTYLLFDLLLINGQRFYQPVDMQLHNGSHTSLKRHLSPEVTNGHNPLRHTSSAEHLDSSPAKAALVAMRIAEGEE
uniref:Uncharacterized protein n=1 Tax=Ditylenchus dipsaci TaxID=166011 RepID=A0A915DDJ2_9BILA